VKCATCPTMQREGCVGSRPGGGTTSCRRAFSPRKGTYDSTIDQVWEGVRLQRPRAVRLDGTGSEASTSRASSPAAAPSEVVVEVVDDDAEERQPLELVPGAVDDDDDDAKRPVHQWTLRCALEEGCEAETDATTHHASSHTSEAERSIWPVDVFGWEPVPNAQMARPVPASHRTVALYRDVAILRLRAEG
jgi:hypothetical protein